VDDCNHDRFTIDIELTESMSEETALLLSFDVRPSSPHSHRCGQARGLWRAAKYSLIDQEDSELTAWLG
jgi:hypothetical protein